MAKTKRAPFTQEEKDYIYEMVTEAREKGLETKTVVSDLADSLGAAPSTVQNVFVRINKQKKDEAAAAKDSIPEQKYLLNEIDTDQIEVLRDYAKEDAQMTLEFAKMVEEAGEIPPAPERPVVDLSIHDFVGSQTKVLLDRIEALVSERDVWKAEAGLVKEENQKLKDKLIKHLLAD